MSVVIGFLAVAAHTDLLPRLAHPWDERRVFEIGLLAFLVLVLVVSRGARQAWTVAFLALPLLSRRVLVVVLVASVASSATAAIPRAAFGGLGMLVLVGMLAVLVAAIRAQDPSWFDRSTLAVLTGSASVYIASFAALVYVVGSQGIERHEHMLGFTHPRFFSQFGMWIFLLLCAAPVVLARKRWHRFALAMVPACWWALVVESGGRAALVATVLGVAFTAMVLGRRTRAWLAVALASFAGGTLLWYVAFRLFAPSGSALRALDRLTSSNGRGELWGAALDMIRAHPLLGVGPQHYALFNPRYESSPHNFALQIAAEFGLIVALSLAGLAVWGMWRWLRRSRDEMIGSHAAATATVTAALTATTTAGGIEALASSGLLYAAEMHVLVALALGWMFALHAERRWPEGLGSGRGVPRSWSATLLGVIALTAMLYCALPYALQPDASGRAWREANPGNPPSPGFWFDADILFTGDSVAPTS